MAEAPAFRLRNEPNLAAKLKAFSYQEEAVEFVTSRDFAAIFTNRVWEKRRLPLTRFFVGSQTSDIDTALVVTKKGLGELEA
ncbi:MAG: hypothetical protein IPI73_24610 [Betaproteobacteria bacterium]|nr:hypothetical protein [Betaproteobacteria bacterium]